MKQPKLTTEVSKKKIRTRGNSAKPSTMTANLDASARRNHDTTKDGRVVFYLLKSTNFNVVTQPNSGGMFPSSFKSSSNPKPDAKVTQIRVKIK